MANEQTAVRKRQKIQDSNRAMFIWVACASVVVGFALVTSWFLWQQAAFTMKVVSAKTQTANTLKSNNAAVDTLRSDIRVLTTNSALESVKTADDDSVLQVILDALPADANSLALGASLQERLLSGVNGLSVESLSVDAPGSSNITTTDSSGNIITFSLIVRASDANTLKDLLSRFERSIRVIDIDSLSIKRSQTDYTMSITAHAYYQPAVELTLGEETIKP